jgi:hypothetical protein
MTRALAVAVFASNWLSWRRIPALENATSFVVSTAILCAVTAILITVALVVHSPPRWLWFGALAATVAQMLEVLIPPAGAGSEWEYVGAIFAMACAALVFVAAIGAFVVSFDRASASHG